MQYYQSVFSSLPVIETARLRLRPLTMRDDRDMFRYASDPEVSRHVLWEAHASPRETRSVLRALFPIPRLLESGLRHRGFARGAEVWV